MIKLPQPVSLLDLMRQFHLGVFVAHWGMLETIRSGLESRPNISALFHNGLARKQTVEGCTLLEQMCGDLGLAASAASAGRLKSLLLQPQLKTDKLLALTKELQGRLFDEASAIIFVSLEADKRQLFQPALFGAEVNDAFPSAISDIEEAGRCLAFGRGTGCVFHLMRVMEVGLKALAKPLGIPYAPSWESYLKQINEQVALKPRKKGVTWKKDESLFKQLAGDLFTVKVAWRNPTMHIERSYSPGEATEVFGAVRSFMRRLSARFPEKKA